MPAPTLHQFEVEGRYYVVDPETCFCFECDGISRDVLRHYPGEPLNRILYLLKDAHPEHELREVVGELEWLRSSKSILNPPKHQEYQKLYELERGLDSLTLCWPPRADAERWRRAAIAALFGRSGKQQALRAEFMALETLERTAELEAHLRDFAEAARVAGKDLTLALRLSGAAMKGLPAALAPHWLDVVIDAPAEAWPEVIAALRKLPDGLGAWKKFEDRLPEGGALTVVCRPLNPHYGGAAKALRDAGYNRIRIDIDAAFARQPGLNPAAMQDGYIENARYYAERLLKRDYFQLEPFASLFRRIHEGAPERRYDPAGFRTLALDADGGVYPSRDFLGIDTARLGNLLEGGIDDERMRAFEDTGSLTTAACLGCWAMNLCGGGPAAVHEAMGGSFRTPYLPWCEAQRGNIEASIAAFNALSSAGVNFAQIYAGLGAKKKPSWMTIARAVLDKPLLVRPLAEADAPLLARWENWNESAYFLCHEAGVLLTNQYDREMDAVHPLPFEQELVVIDAKGDALGLLRLRPDAIAGLATAWVFLHNPLHYAAGSVRRGFKALLREIAKQDTGIRRVRVPTGPKDEALRGFLAAAGFEPLGSQREALYLHGAYHPVEWLGLTLE
ncbi:MAG: SPASM domain-containing protein [Candidatus Hydrogenedens sp.]|nr:SPASM domain-containing protein [Candidatus Hydrogenedens sp.]